MADAAVPPSAPDFPQPGDRLPAANPSPETLAFLARRRSAAAAALTAPGPDAEQLNTLLRIAARVPDHGKLAPWRFMIFEDEAKERFAAICEKIYAARTPGAEAGQVQMERDRLLNPPVIIAVVSSVLENHKIPEWEQILSAGAACMTLLNAANAMGFAGQWRTDWMAYDPQVKDMMGLRSGERVAGFIYLGTAPEDPVERKRPDPQIGAWKG